MPLFVIEREFAEELDLTSEDVRLIDEIIDREQPVEVDRPRHLIEIGAREPEVLEQVLREMRRAVVRSLETRCGAVAAFE